MAAWEPPARAGTGSRPVRIRCHVATTAGTRFMSRYALRRLASRSSRPRSGSSAAASETAVRSASSGWQSVGSARSSASTGAGRLRSASSRARNEAVSAGPGSSPNHSKEVACSKLSDPATSPIS